MASTHYRSHTCGDLREADAGGQVRLAGWVHRKRDHGQLLFVDLRDHYGVTQTVIDELRDIAGVTARPRFTRISRWPKSMAQYTVGHPARLKEIESRVAALTGIEVAGNAYQGIGIPDCIRMGRSAAEKFLAA